MNSSKPTQASHLIPLLVIGIMLNTIGVVLSSLGNVRYVFMLAGLALMLFVVVKMLASRSNGDSPPS